MSEKKMRLDDLMPIIREQLAAGQTVSFFPNGVSMLPMLRQGQDSVVLSPAPERLKKYDLPLYLRDNGQYVLHRVVSVGEGYTCVGDNQFLLEPGVEHRQVIALVTAFTRDGRRVEVTDLRYQIYCRFWCASRPLRHFWRGWLRPRLGRLRRCLK